MIRVALLALTLVAPQDLDKILDRADKLMEEAKAAYEAGRSTNSVPAFVDAGFKLEEARIKYLSLQEISPADRQPLLAERVRSLNQLGKLVHDGKVAVTGTAAAMPAAPPEPPRRAPVPDAARQRDAERVVKDLYKDQYAKKAPADRKSLARMLLEQATQNQSDVAACWVLCREAQEIAAAVGDGATALEAVDVLTRVVDVDGLPMKAAALTTAAKAVKTPEQHAALAGALLTLSEDLVRVDQYEAADKAAAQAAQSARKSNDAALAVRTATASREIADGRVLVQSMKGVLETQARNPNDPAANLEIGLFHCLIKGNWDLGLRFLAKGSDPQLKALAEKEGVPPARAADRIAVADGWFELADREKSALRKSRMTAHAKALYAAALPDATELLKLKIQKRLDVPAEPGAARPLAALAPGLLGHWKLDEGQGGGTVDALAPARKGTLKNGAKWGEGHAGKAVQLDGVDDHVELESGYQFAAASALAVSAWFKTTDANGPIVSFRSKAEGGAVIDLAVGYDGIQNVRGSLMGLVRQDRGDGGWARITGGVVNDGKWHHAVLTRDERGGIELFLDGASQGKATGGESAGPITVDWCALGSERCWVAVSRGTTDEQYLDGTIDDVRVYTRTPTPDEIRGVVGK